MLTWQFYYYVNEFLVLHIKYRPIKGVKLPKKIIIIDQGQYVDKSAFFFHSFTAVQFGCSVLHLLGSYDFLLYQVWQCRYNLLFEI